jgi:hypothetical protein
VREAQPRKKLTLAKTRLGREVTFQHPFAEPFTNSQIRPEHQLEPCPGFTGKAGHENRIAHSRSAPQNKMLR